MTRTPPPPSAVTVRFRLRLCLRHFNCCEDEEEEEEEEESSFTEFKVFFPMLSMSPYAI
ncbi:hypothetical protein INR49_031640 [Caranx melampygus]|nr:hypothetical protein INR49_031640 [Caranx melampygus]